MTNADKQRAYAVYRLAYRLDYRRFYGLPDHPKPVRGPLPSWAHQ